MKLLQRANTNNWKQDNLRVPSHLRHWDIRPFQGAPLLQHCNQIFFNHSKPQIFNCGLISHRQHVQSSPGRFCFCNRFVYLFDSFFWDSTKCFQFCHRTLGPLSWYFINCRANPGRAEEAKFLNLGREPSTHKSSATISAREMNLVRRIVALPVR